MLDIKYNVNVIGNASNCLPGVYSHTELQMAGCLGDVSHCSLARIHSAARHLNSFADMSTYISVSIAPCCSI